MNGYTFRTELAKLAPDYVIETDNDGQIVIYTGLTDVSGNYIAADIAQDLRPDPDGNVTHCGRPVVIEDCPRCGLIDEDSTCFAFRCSKCGGRGTYDCEEVTA